MPTPVPDPFPVDVLDNWVDYWTLVIAALSLLATAIGAFLIWRQIRQTGAALNLANDEQETNRRLLLDSRRARIDDEMPKLLVWVDRQSEKVYDPTAPKRRRTLDRMTGRMTLDPDPLEQRVFNVLNPSDMSAQLDVSLRVVISNDGPRRALITVWQERNPDDPSESLVIEVGTTAELVVRRRHSVAEWIDYSTGYYEPRQDGQDAGTYSEVTVMSLYYPFPGRVGAVDRWKVVQGGGILEPVGHDMGQWRIREVVKWTPPLVGGLNAVVPFPEREYFADMNERRPLGETPD